MPIGRLIGWRRLWYCLKQLAKFGLLERHHARQLMAPLRKKAIVFIHSIQYYVL
jgi:hypothetical protein